MRCNQCNFENLPGLTRCFKCGSVLVDSSEPLEINPPRMRRWKKPIRDLNRAIRGSGFVRSIPRPAWLDAVASDSFLSVCFSIIPGFGHLLYRRFRKVALLLSIWLLLVLAGVFMYGSNMAMSLIGLAVGLHAFIAISCSYMDEEKDILRRMGAMLVLCIFIGVLYYVAGGLIFKDYSAQFSAMEIPACKVQTGDLLLARKSLSRSNNLAVGDLVLVHTTTIGNRRRFYQADNVVVAQVIGKGGDVVGIKEGVYYLNDKVLDASRFPVPLWLHNAEVSVSIPADSYFLSMAYQFGGRNGAAGDYVRQACVVTQERIEAKVFMRWLPLTRRGFIKGSS